MQTDRARQRIRAFLSEPAFAVAGASTVRAKFGNRVLRCYLQHGREVFALNPREAEIEGVACFVELSDLPERVTALSIVTPSAITERLIEACPAAGIRRVWMQPGAESTRAVERAEELGLEPLAGGPCLLVELGCRAGPHRPTRS